MTAIEIKVPSNPRLLKVVRCGIQHLCEVCGFTTEDRHAVTLAVDEAIANIIRHAYRGRADGSITVCCEILENSLQIVLRDNGIKAKTDEIKSRDLEDVRPGGLGVHLIQSTMDVMEYQHSAGVNELTLIKYLPGRKKKDA